MKYKQIEVGSKIGRLTIIAFDHKNEKSNKYWLCKCDCGNMKVLNGNDLLYHGTKSCGCMRKEICREKGRKKAKQNRYEILEDKIKCFTSKNEVFYISKESEWVLKDYCWHQMKDKSIRTNDKKLHKSFSIHRLLLQKELNNKCNKRKVVDHIDGNPSNNCLSNLRIVTESQNQWNRVRQDNYCIKKDEKCSLNPYQVAITCNNENYYIGAFPTLEEAKQIRDKWENEHERKDYFRLQKAGK